MLGQFPTRNDVIVALSELLEDRFPWTARELACEVQSRYGWSLVNKQLVNSILYRELRYRLYHDPVRHTWQIH